MFLYILMCGPAGSVIAREVVHLDPHGGSYSLQSQLDYLEDPSGKLTLQDVMRSETAARFKPHPDSKPNFGNTTSAFWFRFQVQGDSSDTHHWFLEADFAPLDTVDLYWQTPSGTARNVRSGDILPFRERAIQVANHVLPMDTFPGEAHTYYLRVTSSGSVTVPLTLRDEVTQREYRESVQLAAGIFFGGLISLGLYNLLLFFSIRDRSYFYYTIATFLFVLVYLAAFGYGFQYLWPNSPDWNNRSPTTLALLALAATAPFSRTFLRTRINAPLIDKLLSVSCITCVVVAVLNLGVIQYGTAFSLFSLLLVLHVPLLLVTSIVCMRRGEALARFFLLAWLPMILAALAYVLRALTILPPHFLTLYGFQVGSALEMILLSFALAHRITQARQEKEIAQEALLHTLRESERVLEERVQQRTGELNAANRALEAEVAERRRAEERLTLLAHHDTLTGLPNRALLKERFNLAASQARRQGKMLGVLLLDLDDFKRINDTLGHDSGDEVLIRVGRTLQRSVRESDTVARVGGDEFVILIADVVDPRAPGDLAQKLLDSLRDGRESDENALMRPGGSIGIALYPQDGADLDTILRHADGAMYQAKAAGRMRYQYYAAETKS